MIPGPGTSVGYGHSQKQNKTKQKKKKKRREEGRKEKKKGTIKNVSKKTLDKNFTFCVFLGDNVPREQTA